MNWKGLLLRLTRKVIVDALISAREEVKAEVDRSDSINPNQKPWVKQGVDIAVGKVAERLSAALPRDVFID